MLILQGQIYYGTKQSESRQKKKIFRSIYLWKKENQFSLTFLTFRGEAPVTAHETLTLVHSRIVTEPGVAKQGHPESALGVVQWDGVLELGHLVNNHFFLSLGVSVDLELVVTGVKSQPANVQENDVENVGKLHGEFRAGVEQLTGVI